MGKILNSLKKAKNKVSKKLEELSAKQYDQVIDEERIRQENAKENAIKMMPEAEELIKHILNQFEEESAKVLADDIHGILLTHELENIVETAVKVITNFDLRKVQSFLMDYMFATYNKQVYEKNYEEVKRTYKHINPKTPVASQPGSEE